MNEIEDQIGKELIEEIEKNYLLLPWYKKFWYLLVAILCYFGHCISYLFLCIKEKFKKHS